MGSILGRDNLSIRTFFVNLPNPEANTVIYLKYRIGSPLTN
jgi:hypothetical protein